VAISLEQFVDRTAESGLVSRAEVQELVETLPAGQRPMALTLVFLLVIRLRFLLVVS